MTKTLLLITAPDFLAQTTGAAPGQGYTQLIFMGLLFAAMYFLMIAPQRKKQKAHDLMLKSLGSGDEIVTTGGIYGTITNVKDDRFIVRIAENTKIEVGKSFVSGVVSKTDEVTK